MANEYEQSENYLNTRERQSPAERERRTDRLNDASGYQRCFACGVRNTSGLQLYFQQEGEAIFTEFTLDERFQGFPGVAHGGILATILDETLSRTATAEGRWMMTGRLEVRYRNVAPIGQLLRCTARTLTSRSRILTAAGDIRLVGDPENVIATAEGTFLPIPASYQQDAINRFPDLTGFFDI